LISVIEQKRDVAGLLLLHYRCKTSSARNLDSIKTKDYCMTIV